jgi:hypothetical protein
MPAFRSGDRLDGANPLLRVHLSSFTIDRAKVRVITTFILDLTDGKPRNILDIISSIKFCLGYLAGF